jgi:uncharacterized membrane protein (DUF2068 family)
LRSRPLPVTIAAILLALRSLTDFPFLWGLLFPEAVANPAFVLYGGIVLGIVGLVVAAGLWLLKTWSFRAAVVVCVLYLYLGAPGVIIAPTAALQGAILVTEVVAALIIVLVVLPYSRRALAASS